MKVFLLALFVAVATAYPMPDDDNNGPVEVIVNGVPEGEPLDISDVLDIKVHEHVDGVLTSAVNALHSYSAAGIAEAAVNTASNNEVPPEPVSLPSPAVPEVNSPVIVIEEAIPEPVILPQPILPEVVVPEPVVLPQPAVPEVIVPEPVVLPQPVLPEVVVPEPVVLPQPAVPEVIPEPAEEAAPVPQIPQGEIYNDGNVQITVNTPQEVGVFYTLQSWLSVVFNYFGSDAQTTHQVV